MTQPHTSIPQPGPEVPVFNSPTTPTKGNGFGVAALVVGVVAVVLSFIPLAGTIAFFLGPIAVVLAVIGLTRKNVKKGTSVAGLVLGVVAVVIAAIVTAIVAATFSAIDTSVKAVDETLEKEHAVEYVVTTSGPANVSYWTGGGTSTEDVTADWKKTITATGTDFLSLNVMGSIMDASTVSCEILVDGASISKNNGSGQGAMASCSGSIPLK